MLGGGEIHIFPGGKQAQSFAEGAGSAAHWSSQSWNPSPGFFLLGEMTPFLSMLTKPSAYIWLMTWLACSFCSAIRS